MQAILRQVEGLSLVGIADSLHTVAMDAPPTLGGLGGGSRPMELVLLGITGCAAMDVLAILRKKRVPLTDFKVEVEAERSDEHPQKITNIVLHYIIIGRGIRTEEVEHAIELTDQKYCGAIEMIRASVVVTHSFEIVKPEN